MVGHQIEGEISELCLVLAPFRLPVLRDPVTGAVSL